VCSPEVSWPRGWVVVAVLPLSNNLCVPHHRKSRRQQRLNRAGKSRDHFISKTMLLLVTLGFERLRNCEAYRAAQQGSHIQMDLVSQTCPNPITSISFRHAATVGFDERERSPTTSGPPGSRSQRLRIKRNCPVVAWCRSDREFTVFARKPRCLLSVWFRGVAEI
jgi:hypothetical protein